MLSDGTSLSCATMTTGTRRMMPSLSGLIEIKPRPAAASSIGKALRNSPGKVTKKGIGSGPRMANPVRNDISVGAKGAATVEPA